jgi:nucleoside-diphosphate-sugar epimerase
VKTVLLTGGTGFVGANLARRLLTEGHRVHLLVRPTYRPWRIVEVLPDLPLHEVDLGDREEVAGLFRQVRPDWVFHLAAYGAYSAQTGADAMVRTNLVGTWHLLDAGLATGFEAFVQAGSSSEYGWKKAPACEDDRLEPNSDYAVTKAAATLLGESLARRHGARVTTLRLYSVYGPWEEPTRFLPTLIAHGLKKRLPPLVDPAVARDFVHVDDVCEAFLRAAVAGSPPSIVNVGTGTQTTIGQVVELARRTFGIEGEAIWGTFPRRAWDTTSWVADTVRMRRDLGLSPRPLAQGFAETVEWARQHRETLPPVPAPDVRS